MIGDRSFEEVDVLFNPAEESLTDDPAEGMEPNKRSRIRVEKCGIEWYWL